MVCEALPELPVLVAVNRYDSKMTGFTVDRLRTLLKCPGLATVANDPQVRAATDQGEPLRMIAPRSAALADIRKLMESLAPEELPSAQRATKSNILGRLTRAFSTLTKV